MGLVFHLILIFFIIFLAIQLYFWWDLDRILSKAKIPEGSTSYPPVSIVIAAHNEEKNLPQLLKSLAEQVYPDFEVIIVNDRSVDDTKNILHGNEQVKVVEIKETPSGWNHKKYALDQGINTAKNDLLLLTDADCVPSSNQWIKLMVSGFANADIVLGISPFRFRNSFLGHFIQFEYLLTAWQYITRAIKNKPYMGVGRNIAYRKVVYIRNKGFQEIKKITGGDDDLLINKWSGNENMAIVIDKDSWVYTEGKTNWKSFLIQKIRHLSVGIKYRVTHKWYLGLFMGSYVFFWLCFLLLLPFGQYFYFAVLGILSRWTIMIPTVWLAKIKLGSKFNILYLLVLDFVYMLYYITTSIFVLMVKRVRWM